MSEGYDQILNAAVALRARGHTVEPDDASERWLLNGCIWVTGARLVSLAVRIGLIQGPWWLQ
ncbi:hypothetical protein ACRAWG_35430 [Methylobacterium sp. P31]